MSWIRLAVGLIREAATTQMGQEILNDIRSNAFNRRKPPDIPPAEPEEAALWRQSVEERLTAADRNAEMLVRMLNAQDEALVQIQKRQRIWNLSLAAGIVLASAAAWLWLR